MKKKRKKTEEKETQKKKLRISDEMRWLTYGVFWVVCPTVAIILFKSLEVGRLIVLDQFYTEIVLLVWTVSLNCKILFDDKNYSNGDKLKFKPLIAIVYVGLLAGPYYFYLKGSSVIPFEYNKIVMALVIIILAITIIGFIFSKQTEDSDGKK